MIPDNLILRWSFGSQDTRKLEPAVLEQFMDMLWLAKLSIISFQRWFPSARFIMFYNGMEFDRFVEMFEGINPPFLARVEYVDQNAQLMNGECLNPYHYFPMGVWWKWVPFRYDIECHEISIDTDIICLNEPKTWYEWFDHDEPLMIAPERFAKVVVNTCGDFYKHPILKDKKPLNCGIVGHKAGHDYSDRFFEVTKEIDFGHTRNSMFITEQGAINVWLYSLELEGIDHYCLDFEKNTWVRDFIYFLEKGVDIETVHATTWHKALAIRFRESLERKVLSDDYGTMDFLKDILEQSKGMKDMEAYVIYRQLGQSTSSVEYFLG